MGNFICIEKIKKINMNKCKTCKFWKQNSDWDYEGAINSGYCSEIKCSDKVTFYLKTGWDGGYVDKIETEENFGCVLHEEK